MLRALVLPCLLVAMLALLVLSGCRQPVPPGALVLSVSASKEEAEGWQDAIGAFSSATGAQVLLRSEEPAKYQENLLRTLGAQDAPDVALVPATSLPRLRQAQLLLPLDAYLQKDENLKLSDFFAPALLPYGKEGGTVALPVDIDAQAIAYNLDLFELAQLKTPREDWTWQDYLKCAQALTRESESGRRNWGTSIPSSWQIYVWQNGGDVVDDPSNPRRSTMSTPAVEEALQFLADLSGKEHVAPPPDRLPAAAALRAFYAGEMGMIYVTTAEMARISRAPEIRWGLLPAPRGKCAANLANGAGLCIPKASRQADAAWKLLAYLVGSDGQKELLKYSFTMPPLGYMAKSEYFGALDSTGRNPFVEAMPGAHQLPVTPRYDEIQKVWDHELAALWAGKTDVKTACAKIDERVNTILEAK